MVEKKFSINDKVKYSNTYISFLKENEFFQESDGFVVGTVVFVRKRAIGGYGYRVLWEDCSEEIYYNEEDLMGV